jgi:hypothetical protein
MTKPKLLGFWLLLVMLWGCGSSLRKQPSGSGITLSPDHAATGSSDLMLTITGSNFTGPDACSTCTRSIAVWSVNGSNTALATTFVSSNQLTAIVPADLLASPAFVRVFVVTVVGQGDSSLPKAVPTTAPLAVFIVSSGPATITSISPDSATAGSSELTLTITGSNFTYFMSVVGWSTTPTDLNCCNTWLDTTFISSTELKAVVPATLLKTPVAAQVFVETGDPQGITDGVSYPQSNPVAFTVRP